MSCEVAHSKRVFCMLRAAQSPPPAWENATRVSTLWGQKTTTQRWQNRVASYTYIYTYTYIHLEGCRRYIYIICICFTVIYTQKSYTSHIHVLSCADNGASQNALKLTRDLKSRHGTPWIHQVGVRLGWGQSHNHNWDIRLVLKKHLFRLWDLITPHVTNFSRLRLSKEKQEGKRKYKSDGGVKVCEFVCMYVHAQVSE